MGNLITIGRSSNVTGKVILSDGSVQGFDKTLTVAELMLEHPQEVVVEFRPDLSGKRPTPLPADKKLDMKKVYLMLPVKRGKPASLTSEEARNVLSSANSVLRSRSLISSKRFLPLFARICPASFEQVVIEKKEIVEKKPPPPVICDSELLPENMDTTPEYLSRQFSGRGWKPSLDTITEKKVEKKKPHWLFNLEA
ncbi:uncharacterized protein [Euphorbia lathyris]|uniref:uncharacterized protein n=1 Tax=Euphorbia lathyris TaxID=212925 RepID=UPI0033130F9D